jgi:type I restriction enzyme S subunit
MNYEFVTLSELSVGGGSYGIAASAVPLSKRLPTYLRITDINDDGTINFGGLKSVADPNASRYYLAPNDIVFARTGASTGRNYFYDGTDGSFVYAGFLIKFSVDPKKVNPLYMKYYCQSKDYYDWVASFNTGSTRGNINAQTLGNMPVPLPPKEQQDTLAATLSALHARIAENRAINHHLEHMAHAIFKSWFVDFEPFADGGFIKSEMGKIPAEWSVATLDGVCSKITDGSLFSPRDSVDGSYPMLSVRDMDDYGFNYQSCKLISDDDYASMVANDCVPLVNDILVAKDGSYLKHIFIVNEQRKDAILSSIAIFRPNSKIICPELLLCLLKYPATQQTIKDNFVSGSALPRIVLKDFKKLKLVLPPMAVQLRAYDLLSAMRKQTAKNQAESDRLAAIRDSLLPLLMSGELSVAELGKDLSPLGDK